MAKKRKPFKYTVSLRVKNALIELQNQPVRVMNGRIGTPDNTCEQSRLVRFPSRAGTTALVGW